MAPEIKARMPYQPQVVDLYALGIVIFVLYLGKMPFNKATPSDYLFDCFIKRDMINFWKIHEAHVANPSKSIPDDFKDLISNMLAYQPYMRLSIADILSHPFFNGRPVASTEEVRRVMTKREKLMKGRESKNRNQ